ncbi:MAG: gluconeogenesis factor YvcK family protein [Vescimonas sp.]
MKTAPGWWGVQDLPLQEGQDCRIRRVRLLPEHPRRCRRRWQAIREADLILLGPGSLYTSIIPNLLVDGIVEAIRALRRTEDLHVCNVMTQEGRRRATPPSDHIRALFNHSWPGLFDLCLTNSSPIPPAVVAAVCPGGSTRPSCCDRAACARPWGWRPSAAPWPR